MKTSTALLWIFWLVSASCSAQTLVIRLYDYADLSVKETARTTEIVNLVFEHSRIPVAWLHCRGATAAGQAALCERALGINEISVRLYPGAPPRADSRTQALGWAVLGGRGGYYATVYLQGARALAAEWGVAFDLLTGYATAHEVGHCLLGPGHSIAGLMRAVWTRKEGEEIKRVSLGLTKQEARKATAWLAAAQPSAARD